MRHTVSTIIMLLIVSTSFANAICKANQQGTLSVEEVSSADSLDVQINCHPTQDGQFVVVEIRGRVYYNYTMKFYNALGKMIYDQKLEGTDTEIDIDGLYFGTYKVQIVDKENNVLKVYKIEKSR